MTFNLIAAVNRSGIIGTTDGRITWDFPADRQHFAQITACEPYYTSHIQVNYRDPSGKLHENPRKAVIMGRKTWDSLPWKPLPHRMNIVLSQKSVVGYGGTNYIFTNTIEGACKIAEEFDEVWVIGGGEIYWEFLERKLIKKMVITEIPTIYPEEGVKFPIGYDSEFNLEKTTIGKDGLIVHYFNKIEGDKK